MTRPRLSGRSQRRGCELHRLRLPGSLGGHRGRAARPGERIGTRVDGRSERGDRPLRPVGLTVEALNIAPLNLTGSDGQAHAFNTVGVQCFVPDSAGAGGATAAADGGGT